MNYLKDLVRLKLHERLKRADPVSASLSLCSLLLLLVSLPLAAGAQTRELKIRGCINALSSPQAFEIADYKISRDNATVLELVDQGPDVQFRLEDLRVGTEVEVTGDYNSQTNELKARRLKVDLDQFRRQKMRAVLSRRPENVERVGQAWRALVFADGRRVRIEPATQVTFAPSYMEKKAIEREAKGKDSDKDKKDQDKDKSDAGAGPGAAGADGPVHTLSSLEDVGPGVLMTYEGSVDADGSVTATSVEFMNNSLQKDEDNIRGLFRAKARPPKYDEGKPGKLTMQLGVLPVDLKIVPRREAQDYIERLGQSLVPAYQRALPDSDPNKVPFKFFILDLKEPIPMGMSHGEVIVTTGMFDILENEAQLAAMLSREIAHVVQKHQYWQFQESTQKRFVMSMGKAASYSHANEAQADRVGLEYMAAAGYDPREAARAWLLYGRAKADKDDLLSRAVERRSYVMLELKNNYQNFDYGAARKNEDEFRKVADLLKSATGDKSGKARK